MNFILSALTMLSLITSLSFAQDAEILHSRTYSVQFIDEMSSHHKMGIEMAEMAINKAYHSELKNMARMMKTMQEKEVETMQMWRERWYPSAPKYEYKGAEMDMSKLERLSGNAFDVAFLDSMILHHGGAIFLGGEAYKRSEKAQIRMLGRKIAKDQCKETLKMRELRDQWGTGN